MRLTVASGSAVPSGRPPAGIDSVVPIAVTMCGVIGYVGRLGAAERFLHGLEWLEYRGYDSAGICVLGPDGLGGREVAHPPAAGRASTAPLHVSQPPVWKATRRMNGQGGIPR